MIRCVYPGVGRSVLIAITPRAAWRWFIGVLQPVLYFIQIEIEMGVLHR
jgi:hypothetical protein